jgi:glycosyltransferase involved in cell wall biosynthesis
VTRLAVETIPKLGSVRYTQQAIADLKRRPADLVHAHSLLSPATTALVAKRRFGIPAIAKVLRGGSLGDLVDLRRKGIGELRFNMLRSGLDGFVAISREIEEELAAAGTPPSKFWFIPNGVDTDRFRPADRAERIRRRSELDVSGDPLVVYMGRLAPEKGLDRLFDAWQANVDTHPDAGLVILGEGPEGERLRGRAPHGVQFAGMISDVAPYLGAADAFVLPSDAEGLSNAMLEAMAAGLAPITTAVGGARDLIDRDNGWLVPVGDTPELTAALDDALGDPTRLEAMGRRARTAVEASYSLDAIADRLADLYRQLTSA